MTTHTLPLEPLPYFLDTVKVLQAHEAAVWDWFSSDRLRQEQNQAARLDLLKCTYRIDRTVHEKLYALAGEVAATLGVSAPVTFYQSQDAGRLNVSLAYMPGEVHVVLTGPVAAALSDLEIRSVLGHELMHFVLLENWRDYLTASQVLAALSNDAEAGHSHLASARLFALYSEVYCDRGSYRASGSLEATVTALAKIETGVMDVSAAEYLRQTDEIFSRGESVSEGITHPETFIRVRAIKLWADRPDASAEQIARLIEGPVALENLDLLGQLKVSGVTRRLVAQALRPAWMRSDALLAHARLFFEDFAPADRADETLAAELGQAEPRLADYYCYVLLDFAAADRDLEEAPLAWVLLLSDELGLGERLRPLAVKELNLRKKQMEALEREAAKIVADAAQAGEAT